ncbi:hypothetical protein DY703_10070 [Salmonella enterica]|nr:hypothetical protein [Salmonella enterica]EEJ5270767.1 hypothetical protein [Salmonella enterica subsp. enterica serovar Poano]
MPCLALPCLALPCLALPCLALPCLALPCLALPCLAGKENKYVQNKQTKYFLLLYKNFDGKSYYLQRRNINR